MKISLYGDSTCVSQQGGLSRAARIAAYSPKFWGFNDYAVVGNSFKSNWAGELNGAPLFGGLTFAQHLATVDDAGIIIFNLGANDSPDGLHPGMPVITLEWYLGCDSLNIGANILRHIQEVKAAGKKCVVVGLPYYDVYRAVAPGGLIPGAALETACTLIASLAIVYANLRAVAGMTGTPWITPFGSPADPAQPPVGYDSTYDGLHPTKAYSEAVSDYIAQRIINIFKL